ncbi:MAG TPA: DUF6428 family protein [Methylomirabilota bacterium]|nr:DUF6428 family protein [Methylomirabilota bacterium]
MKLNELKTALAEHPETTLRFILPNGESVPAHAHVTEVARIEKRFIDCGGTLRNDLMCRLQTWTANDYDHRLTAKKLLGILNKAASFLTTDDVEVDVEHEVQFISQFPLDSVELDGPQLLLKLTERHTACLALDKCGVQPKAASILFKPLPTFEQPKCCA